MNDKKFICPGCGGEHFGRDTGAVDQMVAPLPTVRCHNPKCGWRGQWPPKSKLPPPTNESHDAQETRPVGRPPLAGESAKGQIQLRVTMARKNAYVRAAKPRKLTAWIFEKLDKASGYEQI